MDERTELRTTLAGFDERQRKIVGGVIAVMIENPERVREREWISEQFLEVTLLACGFEGLASVQEGRDRVQDYVRANIDPLLNACFVLFKVVAEDLAPQLADGITREDAVAHALGYTTESPDA